ncbi:MAG: single-stranded DNA-binding protein, partial [Bacteroidetes bacterium]|nr:single-stranded DNA-binding protein [Bacteroidota bacterium]
EVWQEKELVWHNILVFNPRVIEMVKRLKKGTRLTLTGALSYRPFKTSVIDSTTGELKDVTKMEASVIAGNLELAPLVKKQKQEAEPA